MLRSTTARSSVRLVVYAVVYAIAHELGRATRIDGSQVSLLWPAALVGVLWLLGTRTRSELVVSGVALTVTSVAMGPVGGAPWSIAVPFAVVNLVLSVVTVLALRRPDRGLRLRDPVDLLHLTTAVLAGGLVSGLLAAATFDVVEGVPFEHGLVLFTTRNALTVFVGLAVLLVVREDRLGTGRRTRPQRGEAVAVGVAAMLAYAAVFYAQEQLVVALAVFPVGIWLAMRFSTRTACLAMVAGGAFVVLETLTGRGVFAEGSAESQALLAQGFVGVMLLVTLSLAVFRDSRERLITALDEVSRQSREQADLLFAVLDSISDGVAVLEPGGTVLLTNSVPGHAVTAGEVIRALPDGAAIGSRGQPDASSVSEVRLETAGGERIIACARRPLSGLELTGHEVVAFRDVTDERKAEQQLLEAHAELRHIALHDPLTGAPNRVLLVDRLERALAVADRTRTRVGVAYLDLDGFKQVNDLWGHAEGDELLRAVTERLGTGLRTGDTLSRLGGDEFVVVLPGVTGPPQVRMLAERILELLRAPFRLASGNVHEQVSASLGVVVSDETSTAEGLLRSADQAMYAAKRSGKDRVEVADERTEARAARADRLLPELREALERDELVMHGQPILDLRTGDIAAVETLVRWEHPDRGLLMPAEFMDVVERVPDLLALERRVLRESCRLAGGWGTAGAGTRVHVNVTARQVEAGRLGQEVERALEVHAIDPARLVLEITETHTGAFDRAVKRDIARLREDGVRVAIDDIGTGYSSLARLTELPVDILKIDKQFVAGIGADPRCEAIIRGVLGIGAALDLEVVAEGIEEGHQVERLREWGCGLGQGFFLARPVDEPTLARSVRAGSAATATRRVISAHGPRTDRPNLSLGRTTRGASQRRAAR